MRRGVVYKVSCKDCKKTYNWETNRTLKVRLREHRQAVKRGTPRMELQCMPIMPSMQLIGLGQKGGEWKPTIGGKELSKPSRSIPGKIQLTLTVVPLITHVQLNFKF